MKKITSNFLLGFAFLCSTIASAQCLTATFGQYPTADITATSCDGINETIIVDDAWAGEYSNVNVVAGETYTFKSSVATDYITISSDGGTSAAISGITPVEWVADVTGVVRFYTHTNDVCGEQQVGRIRSFVCGIAPCTLPMVTFAKTFDCDGSTFQITADITDMGTASSITVSDDQSSPTQGLSSANIVTFGPYAFGTTVTLTVTNDQTPVCNVVSDAIVVYACPPTNDLCEDAIVLNCGDTLTNQITDGATGGTDASCLGTIGDEIWYSFLGDGQVITVTATAAVQFPQIEVYPSTDGTCAGFTIGDCMIAAGTGEPVASVSFVSVIGTTYYMHVGNYINGDPAVVFNLAIECATPATPPANDDCSGAYAVTVNPDLTCTSVTAGTLVGATPSSVDNTVCDGMADDDVWFSFVASETAYLIGLNNVTGSTEDLYHSLWTGDCSALTLVTDSCNDSNSGVASGLTIGETYYIRVYSYTAEPLQDTTFDVCIGTLPPAPANDECAGALVLNCADTLTGQTTLSATGGSDTSCIGTIGADIWYSVTGNGQLLTLSAVASVEFPQMQVYESTDGACTGFTEGTCFLSAGTGESTIAVTFPSTLGTTYYIQIGNYINGNPGVIFDLSVTCADPPPTPSNDECANAEALVIGTPATGTTAGATTTVLGITPSCQENRTNDVWYSIEVPASGSITFDVTAASGSPITDTVITVFSGSCGSFVEEGCNDDNTEGLFSTLELTELTAGETLLVGVWRYSLGTGVDGAFTLSATDPGLATDTFDDASFRAVPNPVKDLLQLSYNKNISNVAVYNLLGQEIIAKSLNQTFSQIDMSHLAAGTYMVKVTADNQTKTIKVVKQ